MSAGDMLSVRPSEHTTTYCPALRLWLAVTPALTLSESVPCDASWYGIPSRWSFGRLRADTPLSETTMKPLSPRLYEPSVRRSRSIRHTHAVEAPPRIAPAAFSAVPRQRRACDAHASSHVAVRESSADDANLRAYARRRRRRHQRQGTP